MRTTENLGINLTGLEAWLKWESPGFSP
jgi:hypothetical protein